MSKRKVNESLLETMPYRGLKTRQRLNNKVFHLLKVYLIKNNRIE
jgi:hypothetical protein